VTKEGKLLMSLVEEAGSASAIALSSDGEFMLTVGSDGIARA